MLPNEIGQLTRLVTLNLSENAFETVPIPVTRLAALTFLNLSSTVVFLTDPARSPARA